MKVVTVVTVMTVMTVMTVATVATVVTIVTKQLCTPKDLNLHKTYLPTYLCNSSDSSDGIDGSKVLWHNLFLLSYMFCHNFC